MVSKVSVGPSARERLLRAAGELFDEQGAHSVGIDPAPLARQLVVLSDGADNSSRMDGDPAIALVSRSVASALIDAAP